MNATARAAARCGDAACASCDAEPDKPCPGCTSRRRRIVRLVEQEKFCISDVAAATGLPVARVERLLEEERDRRDVAAFERSRIENVAVRALFETRRQVDPCLTVAELARRVGRSQVQVERWLGMRATAPKTTRDGRTYPARTLERISVDVAGRLVRAIGYAPCELEGC